MGFEDIAHHLSRAALLKHEAEEPGEASVVGHEEASGTDADDGDESLGAVVLAGSPFPPDVTARWKARLEKASQVVYGETALQTTARLATELAPGGVHHAIVSGNAEHAAAHVESMSVEDALILAMTMHFATLASAKLIPMLLGAMRGKMVDAESGH